MEAQRAERSARPAHNETQAHTGPVDEACRGRLDSVHGFLHTWGHRMAGLAPPGPQSLPGDGVSVPRSVGEAVASSAGPAGASLSVAAAEPLAVGRVGVVALDTRC